MTSSFIFRIIPYLAAFGISTTLFSVVYNLRNAPPSLEVLTPTETYEPGMVPLRVNASDSDGEVRSVRFFIDEQLVAVDQNAPYEAEVELLGGEHSFTVIVRDDGRARTISHRQIRPANQPPEIVSITPADGAVLPRQTTTIEVTAEDPEGDIALVTISLDGEVVASLTDAPYSVDVLPSRGEHVIDVTVEDAEGETASETSTFTIEANQAPRITSIAPAQGSTLPFGPTTIAVGATDDDGSVASVTIALDGSSLGTLTSPPYEMEATPSRGSHFLQIQVVDDEGASTSIVSLFSVEANEIPSLTITHPEEGATLPFEPTYLSATASDTDGSIASVTFVLDDEVVGVVKSAPFGLMATPGRGPHVLEVIAEDNEGATRSATRTFSIVGNQSPVITSVIPEDGASLLFEETTIEVEANDPDGSVDTVTIYLDDEELAVLTQAPYTVDVTPARGAHLLAVVATDNEGTSSTWESNFSVVPNQAPIITSITPTENAQLPLEAIDITVAAEDSDGSISTVTIILDGEIIAVDNEAPFTVSTTPGRGNHIIDVVVEDNEGGTAQSSSPFTVIPNEMPVITSISPASGDQLPFEPTTITVEASDADGTVASVSISLDGEVVATDNSAPYSAAITPSRGAHIVEVTVTDNEGATTTESSAFSVVDNDAPSIDLIVPLEGDVLPFVDTLLLAEASDTDGTIASITFTLDGTEVASFSSPPYITIVPAPSRGEHVLEVTATDNENLSTTATRNFSITPNLLPSVDSITPAEGASVAFVPLTISVAASDDDGAIASVAISMDGNLITTDTTAPYTATLTPARGAHSISVTVTDNEGGQQTSTSTFTVVPNDPPIVEGLVPGADTTMFPGEVVFAASTYDTDGSIAEVEYFLNGTSIAEFQGNPGNATVRENLTEGSYTFMVTATDNEGASTSANTTFTIAPVPNTAPTITFASPTNGAEFPSIHDINVVLNAVDADNDPLTVQLLVDSEEVANWNSAPYATNLSGLPEGNHILTAIVTDNADASASANIIITIATPQPIDVLTIPEFIGVLEFTYADVADGNAQVHPDNWTFEVDGVSIPYYSTAGEIPQPDDQFFVYLPASLAGDQLTILPSDTPNRMEAVDATFDEEAVELNFIFELADYIEFQYEPIFEGYFVCSFLVEEHVILDISDPMNPRFMENAGLLASPGDNCSLLSIPGNTETLEMVLSTSLEYLQVIP